MFKNSFFLLVLLLLLSLGLVQAQDEPVQVTWLTLSEWGGNINLVIETFEEAHPNIDIVLEQVPFNTLFEQIQVRLSSGSSDPDVLSIDVPLVAGYGLRGWLLPLDSAFDGDDRTDWLASSVDAGSYNGELLAAPVSTSTQLLFYNADIFAQVGLTPPGPNDRLTYEEIAELAQQLTIDEDDDGVIDKWGFAWEQTNRIYQLQPLPVSLGGEAIGEDGLSVEGIINSEEWIEAFTYYANVFNEWGVGPQEDTVPVAELFQAGNLAMMVGGPWQINSYIRADVPFEWGVSRHPYFADGEIVTPTGSWHIGINANTDVSDAALTFVNWFSTGEGAELWWREGNGDFPAQQSILDLFQTDAQFEEEPFSLLRIAAAEAAVNPVPRPVSPGYLEYEQILQNTFTDIRTGTPVEEALNTAVDRIESEMAKYRR